MYKYRQMQELIKNNLTQSEIAKELNISRPTAYKYVEKYYKDRESIDEELLKVSDELSTLKSAVNAMYGSTDKLIDEYIKSIEPQTLMKEVLQTVEMAEVAKALRVTKKMIVKYRDGKRMMNDRQMQRLREFVEA